MKKFTRFLSSICILSLIMSYAASAVELPTTDIIGNDNCEMINQDGIIKGKVDLPVDGYKIVSEVTVALPAPENTTIEQTTTVYENGGYSVSTFTVETLPSKEKSYSSGEKGASNITEVYDTHNNLAAYIYVYAVFSWDAQDRVVGYRDATARAVSYGSYGVKETHWHPKMTSNGSMIFGRTLVNGAMPVAAVATIGCDYNGNLSHESYETHSSCPYC